jgi:hypothetical protein
LDLPKSHNQTHKSAPIDLQTIYVCARARACIRLPAHCLDVAGESYAGQYIPTLMDQIHTKGADHRSDGPAINLKGAAVGNGVGGGPTARGGRVRAKFYYNKGMISQKTGDAIEKECGSLSYQVSERFPFVDTPSTLLLAILPEIQATQGSMSYLTGVQTGNVRGG